MGGFLFHSHEIFKDRRRDLRANQTPEEQKLWKELRYQKLGYKFQRQHSIGRFIVDFYCAQKKLIIELDGGQHKDSKEYDKERTDYFNELGLSVLRFWNSSVTKDMKGVLQNISDALRASS